MAPKFHHLSYSYTLLLIFSFTTICQSHSQISSALDFLKQFNGTHKGDQAKGLSLLKEYLTKLGYIDSTIPINKNDDFFDDTLELAIKKYQKFYNLKTTGFLDQETLTLMLQPRCGVPDFPTITTSSGNSKTIGSYYNVTGRSWPPNKRNLTVSIPVGFRKDAFSPVLYALEKWAAELVPPFEDIILDLDYDHADVKICFERRDHGDGHPFDGPGGTLAHSFYPPDGRLHFDADENWRPYAVPGAFDIGTVALHELGHIFGLGHSTDPKAIMFAYINAGESKGLGQDDIDGIMAIYPRG